MKKRLDKLKTDLKLTSAQEGAWTSYLESMKPAGALPPVTAKPLPS